MGRKVLLAMSGGIDSSVSAYLLKQEGYDVTGVFMRNGAVKEGERNEHSCCSLDDAYDARRVAHHLGIPFYNLNFKEDFDRIIAYFVQTYNRGRTPNPCIMCNAWIKFGRLFDYARLMGMDHVATGHYARVEHGERSLLKRGLDPTKDQSYVLFPLQQPELKRVLFPVGALEKTEVRRIADQAGIRTKNKPDSQDICFVPDGDYSGLIRKRTPEAVHEGEIVNREGEKVGTHRGYQFFTIGQRRGLGVAAGRPQYVVSVDPAANQVVIGDPEDIQSDIMQVRRINWLAIDPPPAGERLRAEVKIRYAHQAAPAWIEITGGGDARVQFDLPQTAVTPGQAAVFYRDDVVVGGGWIES